MIVAYLDCNATTPVEPAVADELLRYTIEEFGNAGSRTHDFGARAKRRVSLAREQVASVVDAESSEIIFTSGATEADNMALLGLEGHLLQGRRHVLSSRIEHKAVLEPLDRLAKRGIEVEYVDVDESGAVDVEGLRARLRNDTGLVTLMHVNNETGVVQPIDEAADVLAGHPALLHVDAAQGFGKHPAARNPRIDLISVSAHKIYGPKGIGCLVARRRDGRRAPLEPLLVGGGQERGLRPGTVPVGLVAAFGLASELAIADGSARETNWAATRMAAVEMVEHLGGEFNGDPDRTVTNTINVSFPGLDNEAAIVALKGIAAVSNGSACTSQSYAPSHVLAAMGLPDERISQALRISWSHLGPPPDWQMIEQALGAVLSPA